MSQYVYWKDPYKDRYLIAREGPLTEIVGTAKTAQQAQRECERLTKSEDHR